ncbi:hypothetical protein DOD04_23995 [Klebsiella michiganensis]|nr:hypothetical protein [Klebsiella michiganensis]QHO85706.1 hypothetical protein CHQ91_07430 [Klebsiella michiganensis]RXI16324.1 hypothetical protein DOD04_23995 [Klebsiella michiganensis]
MCVGCVHSPESLTTVSSSGFVHLPPSCNSNYLGYRCFFRVWRKVVYRQRCSRFIDGEFDG